MTPTPLFRAKRTTEGSQARQMAVDVALDCCRDSLAILPITGMTSVPREALRVLLDHHTALAASVDTLRLALIQRELDDAHTPVCAPCTRIRRGL